MKDEVENPSSEIISTENGIDTTLSDAFEAESVKMENGFVKTTQMEEAETAYNENNVSAMEAGYKTSLGPGGKFTRIGKAQLINKSLIGNKKSEKKKKKVMNSLTQMIVIRNVMSKERKAPLYNFKIRPVHKRILAWKQTPIVYLGAPLLNPDNVDNEEYAKNVLESLPTATSSNLIKTFEDEFSVHDSGEVFDASTAKVERNQPEINDSVTTSKRNFSDEVFSELLGIPGYRSSTKLPEVDMLKQTSNKATMNLGSNPFPVTVSVNTNPTTLSNIVQIIARTVPSAVSTTTLPTAVTVTQIKNGNIKVKKDIKMTPKKVKKGLPVSTFTFAQGIPVPHCAILPLKNSMVKSSALNTVSTDSTKLVMSSKQVISVSSSLKPTPGGNPVMTISVLPQPAGSKGSCLPLRNIVVKTSTTDGKSSQPVKALFIPCSIKKNDISATKLSQSSSQETKHSKIIAMKASSTLAKMVQAHKNDKTETIAVLKTVPTTVVKTLLVASSDCKTPKRKREDESGSSEYGRPTKRLRTGVEIAFVDGVRHFVTNLKQMTYLDDEPIKRWSDLKKGTKVAALWRDGLFYDASVVACYFPNEKYTGVVEVLTAPKNVKEDEEPTERSSPNSIKKPVKIICSKCKTVFAKISEFRKHQKSSCKSYGININSENGDKNIVGSENSECSAAAVEKENNKDNNKKISVRPPDPIPESDRETKKPPCRDKNQNSLTQFPAPLVNGTEKSAPKSPGGHYLFSVGTRFLHRWQLDDGSSKWYQGEVKKVLSLISDTECEFEVLYKDEEDQGPYVVKLYEDYPFDIRIMGRS